MFRHACVLLQIKFVEVTEEELEVQRAAFANGQLPLETIDAPFDLAAYNVFLHQVAPEAKAFQAQQQAASAKQVFVPPPHPGSPIVLVHSRALPLACHLHVCGQRSMHVKITQFHKELTMKKANQH